MMRAMGWMGLMLALAACGEPAPGDAACPPELIRSGVACVEPTPPGSSPGAPEPAPTPEPAPEPAPAPEPTPEPDPVMPPAGEVGLPLTVDSYYTDSGFMGDGESGNIVTAECPMRGDPAAVGLCHGFRWTAGPAGWAGVFWQSPEGNWGDQPGVPIAAGATEISFLAWGAAGGERVKFIAGYADADGFAAESAPLDLSTTPTRYAIPLDGVSYDEVRAGFGWATVDGAVAPMTLFVDDVQWR